jgi:hypothetical protein
MELAEQLTIITRELVSLDSIGSISSDRGLKIYGFASTITGANHSTSVELESLSLPVLETRPSRLGTSGTKLLSRRVPRNHFPSCIRLVYISSNASGPTPISPRNGLSKAPSR